LFRPAFDPPQTGSQSAENTELNAFGIAGNAHVIDPSVAEKRDVSESVPFRGRCVPLLWQVPGEAITSRWEMLLPHHGTRTQVLGPLQGS
jgi:hypothetical protein